MFPQLFTSALTLLLMAIAIANVRAADYAVTVLHPTGHLRSTGLAASNSGQVGFTSESNSNLDLSTAHAALWSSTAASYVDLHPVGYHSSVAWGVFGNNQVGSADIRPNAPSTLHAMLWNGTAASAIDLHPAGLSAFADSEAYGVFGNTQVGVVDGSRNGLDNIPLTGHATLWSGTAASAIDLHPAGYSTSAAFGVSGTSQVGQGFLTSTHALLWNGSSASVVDLHPASYSLSVALGVSGAQQVGYGRQSLSDHALLWNGTAASVVDLHSATFFDTTARAVSSAGQVGEGRQFAGPSHALYWNGTAASVVDLHQFLAPLGTIGSSTAWGIADNGTIVGEAQINGVTSAVMWTPVPEPTAAVLLATIAPFLCCTRSHRSSCVIA